MSPGVGDVAPSGLTWSSHRAIDTHSKGSCKYMQQNAKNHAIADSHYQRNHHQPASWKSSVSRAITFGSPTSSEKVSKFMRDQFETMRYCDRNKWNFDFYSEKPASSKSGHSSYDWKKSMSNSNSSMSSSTSSVSSSSSSDYSFYGYKQSNSFKHSTSGNSSSSGNSSYKSYQSTKKK